MSRHIMRIELTPDAKKNVSALSDSHGMTQVAIMSRLVEWFASESEVVRSAVIGHFPKDIEADIAQIILKRMAGQHDADQILVKKAANKLAAAAS